MIEKQIEIKDRNEIYVLNQYIVIIFILCCIEMFSKLVVIGGKYYFNMVLNLNGFMY